MAQLSFFHSFILYCPRLIVTLASPNLGCASTIKKNLFYFVLCSAFTNFGYTEGTLA